MISLKKFIDSKPDEPASAAEVAPSATLPAGAKHTAAKPEQPGAKPAVPGKDAPETGSALSAYVAALAAMGASGQRAVPVLGNMIYTGLARIGDNLARSASPETVSESRRMVEEQLGIWADKAQQNQKDNEQAIKDLIKVVAEAAESTGVRDEKFSREIAALCDRLRATAGMESLPVIRRSIAENTTALSGVVTRMAYEGRESIGKLTSEIAEYRARLEVSERRAMVDPLTLLCNRRGFEDQLEIRMATRQTFSLLVADLNGFKITNDTYGHLAGDEILRQFASEMKNQFRPEDTVARWGGDEFAAIVIGPAKEGEARAERVRHWALGDYKISVGAGTTTVKVDAAIGTIVWNGTESAPELFARADKEMYVAKESSKAKGSKALA